MVFAIISFFPAPKDRAKLLEILRSVQDSTVIRSGCLGCWLDRDFFQNHVRYGEQWTSEEDLHNHIRSDLYRRILAAMELSRRPPEIGFHHVSLTEGIELIQAVRCGHHSP